VSDPSAAAYDAIGAMYVRRWWEALQEAGTPPLQAEGHVRLVVSRVFAQAYDERMAQHRKEPAT
jgi:hypothetical protein